MNGRISTAQYPYLVLKSGMIHLTQILSTEFSLRKAPIRVNGIAPGVFPSELVGNEEQLMEYLTKGPAKADPNGKEGGETLNAPPQPQPIPMGRPGRAQEMAALAVYLASPASAYTHGQEIIMDGGWVTVNP